MALTIRKKVSLEFLGEEYKESYLVFRAIPLKDFESLIEQINAVEKDGSKSFSFISTKLKEYFVSGKAANESGTLEDVTKDDIENLDQESIIKCFEALTGQNVNREDDFLEKDSNKPSSTAQDPQPNS